MKPGPDSALPSARNRAARLADPGDGSLPGARRGRVPTASRGTLEWRNWQTHWTQNPAPFTGHEGSTPSSSTIVPTTETRRASNPARSKAAGAASARRCRTGAFAALGLAIVLASSPVPVGAQNTAAQRRPATIEGGFGDGKPAWLSLTGEFRVRYENRQALGFAGGRSDGYPLIRTRLNIGIKANKWLRFGFQGQDSRAPGIRPVANPGAFRDGFDVRQAYVEIGGDKSPVSVTAGRQIVALGDQRLVGALDWSNTARVFDAVNLELRGPGAKVNVFSASVVQTDPYRRINQSAEGNNLHGIYASFENVIPRSTLEPYVLWQTQPLVTNELGIRGDLDRYTTGVRVWAKGLGPWDYNAAIVGQRGNSAGAEIRALGYYAELGYSLDERWDPRLYVEYNFGSGDDDPNDGQVGGFVDLYPTAHLWYGYVDQTGWRNLKNIRLGAEVAPSKKLQLRFDFHSFWLASKRDGLYNVGGRLTIAAPPGGAEETKIGDEVNAIFTVPVSDLLSLGGGVGHLFPGHFVKANSPGSGHTFSYLFIWYKF